MSNNSSKLQNIQPPTQPSDGLSSGVVEPDSLTGGQIDGGPITGAAEENIERRTCDCKDGFCFCEWDTGAPEFFKKICRLRR